MCKNTSQNKKIIKSILDLLVKEHATLDDARLVFRAIEKLAIYCEFYSRKR